MAQKEPCHMLLASFRLPLVADAAYLVTDPNDSAEIVAPQDASESRLGKAAATYEICLSRCTTNYYHSRTTGTYSATSERNHRYAQAISNNF